MSINQMEQYLFTLKYHAKELQIQSRKCARQQVSEKLKCKKAIQKSLMEKARIHAENAVRQNCQSLNFLRMSARVDAVASRCQAAISSRRVTGAMAGVCKTMEQAMKTLDLETIAKWMERFEAQFDNMDVQTAFTETAMGQTTTTSTPLHAVNTLMQSVAEEAGLDLRMDLPRGGTDTIGPVTAPPPPEGDDLSARLARLRTK